MNFEGRQKIAVEQWRQGVGVGQGAWRHDGEGQGRLCMLLKVEQWQVWSWEDQLETDGGVAQLDVFVLQHGGDVKGFPAGFPRWLQRVLTNGNSLRLEHALAQWPVGIRVHLAAGNFLDVISIDDVAVEAKLRPADVLMSDWQVFSQGESHE